MIKNKKKNIHDLALNIYTNQECNFIDKAIELLEIEATKSKAEGVISSTLYTLKLDDDTEKIFESLMMYNYNKNFN